MSGLDPSTPSPEIGLPDLEAFACGKASPETVRLVAAAIREPESEASLFLAGLRTDHELLLNDVRAATAKQTRRKHQKSPRRHPKSKRFAAQAPATRWTSVGVFLGIGTAFVSFYIGPAAGALYFVASIGWELLALGGYRREQDGTLFDCLVGSIYVGTVGLLPALFSGIPISNSVNATVVILALIGAHAGWERGFGWRDRIQLGLSTGRACRQFAVLLFVNLGNAWLALGLVALARTVWNGGHWAPNSYRYILEWFALLTLLPAIARLFKASPIRCTFQQALLAVPVGTFMNLFYLAVCLILDVHVEWQLVFMMQVFGTSIDMRILVYSGYESWVDRKYGALADTIRALETIGIAILSGYLASVVIDRLEPHWPKAEEWRAWLMFTSAWLGFYIGERRWYRVFLPRKYRGLVTPQTDTRLIANVAVRQFSTTMNALGVAFAGSLEDVATFYIAMTRPRVPRRTT
jgi:hypothetical protein